VKKGALMKFYQTVIILLICVILLILLGPHLRAAGFVGDSSPGTIKIIHQRKSVRKYESKAVSRDILVELVKAGMAAPTAADKRPWDFTVVTDKTKLKELSTYQPYAKMVETAAAAIIVSGVPSKGLEGVANDFWVQDCSAATQNILLAAEALGLGAVWTGAWPLQDRAVKVRQILGMSDQFIPLNVIAVGYPTGIEKPKVKFDASAMHFVE
jgi:nitroreductase